jgi:hypothetical protein
MERSNLKKLNKVKGKERYHVEVPDRFAVLGKRLERTNISAKESLGYFEMKQHKPWFDEGFSLHQRKQVKLQWLQHPSEINGNNLNNVRREARRYFRNKRKEYLKDKINKLATYSKSKNIKDLYRGINEF